MVWAGQAIQNLRRLDIGFVPSHLTVGQVMLDNVGAIQHLRDPRMGPVMFSLLLQIHKAEKK